MDAQLKKGLLDACVLHILKQGDTYGYRLTQQITGFMEISESALYPVLRRLEAQGFLDTYSAEHSGRLRRYYRITADGILRLNEYKTELLKQKKIINFILGGEYEHE